MFLRQSPLLRLLIPLCAGIIAGNRSEYSVIQIAVVLFVAVVFYIMFSNWTLAYKHQWVRGLIINAVVFIAGLLSCKLHNQIAFPHHFSHFKYDCFIVRITTPLEPRIKSVKAEAEVTTVYAGKWINTSGTVRLLFQMQDSLPAYGDYIIIKGTAKNIAQPLNPYEFNNAAYLANHNIYQQLYIPDDEWAFLNTKKTSWLYSFSWKLRDHLIAVLKNNLEDENIYSVASALLVGYEEDIDADILKAYSGSGTLHVLSVSGMHVALIYKVLEWLLSFLLKMRRGRHLYYSGIILFVWFYSLLSGLSPSVLRAAMMLTLVVGGKWMSRTSLVHNSMFVSCFLLLIFNPSLLNEVGFQLSILAVGGIVFIHPLLFRVYTPKGKLMFALWSVVSVSICAQLITFPIGLFYFHQFPNLFLISNIIIIPATTIAIYAAIILVVVYKIPFISFLIAKALYASIWFSNQTALVIDNLPGSVINGISINEFEVVFIYFLMIILIMFLLRRQAFYLCIFFAGVVIFSISQSIENYRQNHQYGFIVFSVKGKSCMLFNKGKDALFKINKNDSVTADVKFHTQSYLFQEGLDINHDRKIIPTVRNNYLLIEKRILVADSTLVFAETLHKRKIDFLVITQSCFLKAESIATMFDVKQVIIDSSVKQSKSLKLKTEFSQLNVPCYDIMKEGAFIYKGFL